MTAQSFVLPMRLALRLRLTNRARLDPARADERLAQAGLAGLAVLFAASTAYAGLLAAGPRRDEVLTGIVLALLTAPLTLTLVPLVPAIGRCAPALSPVWPLSAIQRGIADITYALIGVWSALSLSVVGAMILTGPPGRWLPGIAAALAATVVVVALCALTRFLMEWLIPRRARVGLALALVALLSVGAAGQVRLATFGNAIPTLIIVDVCRDASSGVEVWRAVALLAGQAVAVLTVYLAAFHLGYWRWRDGQEQVRFSGASNAISRLQPLAELLTPRAAARGVFGQHLTYLSRSPRAWFLLPYGPVFGLIFLRQWADESSPAFQAFFLTLWIAGGCCVLLYNQFGFDGRGIALWQYAPVSDRDLLAGKNLASFVAAVPSAVLCGALVTWQTAGDIRVGLASVFLLGYFMAIHSVVGNFASAACPEPLPLRNMTRAALSALAMLFLLLTLALSAGLAGLVWRLAAADGSLAILGAQALLLLAVWPASRALLTPAAGHLSRQREQLVATVMEASRA